MLRVLMRNLNEIVKYWETRKSWHLIEDMHNPEWAVCIQVRQVLRCLTVSSVMRTVIQKNELLA